MFGILKAVKKLLGKKNAHEPSECPQQTNSKDSDFEEIFTNRTRLYTTQDAKATKQD